MGLAVHTNARMRRTAVALACGLALASPTESLGFLRSPQGDVIAPSRVLRIRDVCRVEDRGDTEVTYYCDDPYVCDRSNPGKCKPGPALQRQLDEERRRLEEEIEAEHKRLEAEIAEFEAQLRAMRGNERAAAQVFLPPGVLSNGQRASGCTSTISLPGDAPRTCSSGASRLDENVYNLAGAPPRRYAPPPPRRVQPAPRPTPRQSVRYTQTIAPLIQFLASLPPDDVRRPLVQQAIDKVTEDYKGKGVDTASTLKQLHYSPRGNSPAPPRAGPTAVSPEPVAPAPPKAPAPDPPTEVARVEPVETPPSPPPVSGKDDALCSFFLTLERGDASNLPHEIPDYCEPYLRSIGRDGTPQPDPRRQRVTSETLDEAHPMADIVKEVLPPGYGE